MTLTVQKGRLSSVRKAGRAAGLVLEEDYLLAPALVDLQVNGGFGIDLSEDPDGLERLCEALPQTGVTRFLPTLPSAPLEVALDLARQVAAVRERSRQVSEPRPWALPIGLHLEGPLLNPKRAGAHKRSRLLSGKAGLEYFEAVVAAGGKGRRPVVSMVTLAPEVEGARALARAAQSLGVVVAAGHSDATFEEASAAIEEGTRVFTHVFNAARPFHHRDPGIIAAYLLHPATYLTLICDGVHVAEPAVAMATSLKGPSRIALVSDAVRSLSASPPAESSVRKRRHAIQHPGSARLVGGSTPLGVCAANFSRYTGTGFPRALHSASGVPASILGMPHLGRLRAGQRVDLVALTESGRVGAVAQGGCLFVFDPRAVRER